MKSTLINFCFLLGTLDVAAQITLQNPNGTMPADIQAPGAPSLGDMRYNEQQRIQQQNAIILQMHNAKDRKSTRLNSSHVSQSRMPSSA